MQEKEIIKHCRHFLKLFKESMPDCKVRVNNLGFDDYWQAYQANVTISQQTHKPYYRRVIFVNFEIDDSTKDVEDIPFDKLSFVPTEIRNNHNDLTYKIFKGD